MAHVPEAYVVSVGELYYYLSNSWVVTNNLTIWPVSFNSFFKYNLIIAVLKFKNKDCDNYGK